MIDRRARHTALDDPDVRAWTNRGLHFSWFVLMVGAAALVGFSVSATMSERLLADLERHGDRIEGVVDGVGERQWLAGRSIAVRFYDDSVERTEVVFLNDLSPSYLVGDRVEVLIDPLDGDRFTVAGEDNQDPWSARITIALLMVAVCSIPAGIVVMIQWSRLRRLLRSGPWQTAMFSMRLEPWGFGGQRAYVGILGLSTDEFVSDPLSDRLVHTSHLAESNEVEYVGRGRWLLIRAVGATRPIRCRRVRRPRSSDDRPE